MIHDIRESVDEGLGIDAFGSRRFEPERSTCIEEAAVAALRAVPGLLQILARGDRPGHSAPF